jgi:Tfp pilus assembly protein PilF
MASKRATVLMAILLLLLLVLGYVSQPFWGPYVMGHTLGVQPPLPGVNTISGLQVRQDAEGRWMADFDYFYTGEPRSAWLRIGLFRGNEVGEKDELTAFTPVPHLERGSHHVSVEIQRPQSVRKPMSESFTTTQVRVKLVGAWEQSQPSASPNVVQSLVKTIASQQVEQVIDWPDSQTWFFNQQFAQKTTDELLKEAVAQIDDGDEGSLTQARRTLEKLISQDPNFDAGYIELARIAMKSNWGPEGLHQAETLLQSALQIRPDSVNAKILLGYVYAHQKRYKLAENIFKDAANSDTKNLWLWANWGEVLVMQGKIDQGIEKYREATSRPRTNDTYDRARLDAYWRLIALLDERNELDEAEFLYKQRAEEFRCGYSGYARFVLQRRGDPAQAIALARKAVDAHCAGPEAREVLGLAHYAAWAAAPAEQRAELLNQARVFLPVGARSLYLLASSERTVVAARKLIDTGESIDQYDNDRFNALAYAVQSRNYSIATRLIRLGARPQAPIGPAQMPVALLPVTEGDLDGIRLMKKSGVDYSKLQYQGKSVLELVRQTGDRKLIDALDPKEAVI